VAASSQALPQTTSNDQRTRIHKQQATINDQRATDSRFLDSPVVENTGTLCAAVLSTQVLRNRTGQGRAEAITFAWLSLFLLLLVGSAVNGNSRAQGRGEWRQLEPGLELAAFRAPIPSEVGDSMVRVLRINPSRFQFHLLNASAPGQGTSLTARQWCEKNGMVAAINASMYQEDRRRSVSLMRTANHVNNPRLSKDRTIVAFDRIEPGAPRFKIIDRDCEDFKVWKSKYNTFVQSIRMISCRGRNVWRQQPGKWSTAAIGTDNRGHVLFIHARALYSTHDLIDILLRLPLSISRAMYLEGGPQAQLYLRSSGEELELNGSFETSLISTAWPIPNVIAISRRSEAGD
jgi:hypothetical protein